MVRHGTSVKPSPFSRESSTRRCFVPECTGPGTAAPRHTVELLPAGCLRARFGGLSCCSCAHTIAVGISPLLLGKRSPVVVANHAYCMAWSYAGLVAAGCGQLAVAVDQNYAGWVVPVAIGTVLCISGVGILGRVPSILDRMES